MKDIILNIEEITKTFARKIKSNNGENSIEKHTVLDKFSLSIEKGKVTALIGGNGSGKTTLFNIISGLLPSNSGSIYFKNGKVTSFDGLTPYSIARLGIGRMFQDAHIFPDLSILENMLLADDIRFGEQPFIPLFSIAKVKAKEKQRIEKAEHIFFNFFKDNKELLDRFNFKKDEPAKNLSYGQQRLLALARLFMADNKLLLLDEPTSGVNPAINECLISIIRSIADEQGITVFIIEHNMSFMYAVSDICAFLNKGKVEFLASPKEVLNNEQVKESYLGI